MSKLMIPTRGTLLAKLPVYCDVQPLMRPRMRGRVKGVYQPLTNQHELRRALSAYNPLRIAEPVIIDTYISLKAAKSSKLAYPVGLRHGDEDNLRKAINDALVAMHMLEDDKFVLGGENYKFFGPEGMCLTLVWSVHGTETKGIDNV